MGDTIIEFKNVSLKFGKSTVHHSLNFSVARGETVTVLGPSGTGKTLVLKMIMGLIRPSGGIIKVMGHEMQALEEEELRKIRVKIGMLFQGAALFDSLSVFENVAYGLREFGESGRGDMPEEKICDIVQERLRVVGLQGIERKFPTQLSGGQKKRVALARALASSPEIMLYDEPTTGLDPTATRRIDEMIVELKQKFGMTSIAVTHDIESAKRVSDRWILLADGVVRASGAVQTVSAENEDVRKFVSGMWDSE